MASLIEERKVQLIARAAADLKQASHPYLEIHLGEGKAVHTVADKEETRQNNPVWDQAFQITLPGAKPDEEPLKLRVTAKNSTTLLPDTTIGSGSVQIMDLFTKSREEVKVPLTDNDGNAAGTAYIGMMMLSPEEEPIPSAAGTVFGEVHRGPQGTLAKDVLHHPDTVPTVHTPGTPEVVGAAMPGQIDDPKSAGYGILKD